MATPPDSIVSLKRHNHPVLGALSLVAIVLSSVALVQSCPPVPAPAAAPAKVEEKPLAVAPVVAPPPAVVAPPVVDAKAIDAAAPAPTPADIVVTPPADAPVVK